MTGELAKRLGHLPASDRALLLVLAAAALVALLLGSAASTAWRAAISRFLGASMTKPVTG